jgi:hypothetical protein
LIDCDKKIMADFRLLITLKGSCKLQIYRDGQWIIYKDATGWEVEYNSYIDVLKHAGRYVEGMHPQVYYEELLLPEEKETSLGVELFYPISGWIGEDK